MAPPEPGREWPQKITKKSACPGRARARGDVLPDGGQPTSVLFIVKAPPSVHSKILVVSSVNTWQAYNTWGGRSLYPADGRPPAEYATELWLTTP